jgi:ElaA protein
VILRTASFADLDAATLYALLKLRTDVFVVEQNCPYPELDGRDTEPATRHLWYEDDDGSPLAYLRVLRDAERTWRIGRVCTARDARGRGLSGQLLTSALQLNEGTFVLDAQSYLVDFYAGFNFAPSGPEYVEDGIPHTPMRRG